MRSCFGHTTGSATSAKAALFATEGDEPLMFAVIAAKAQKPVRHYAARKEGLEFFRHMSRQVLSLFATEVLETSQVFLNDFVEECAFGATPLVASIVPRKGRLPMSVMMRSPCDSLALLLHNTPPVQSMGHRSSPIPPCRPVRSLEPVFPIT